VQIFAKEGDRVDKDAPLYQLDDRELKAEYELRLATAQSQYKRLQRLKNLPRPEEVAPLEAQVNQAQTNLSDLQDQLSRLQKLHQDGGIVSLNDLLRKQFQVEVASKQLKKAQADLIQLKAGAWKYDIQQAEADYRAALAQANMTKVNLDRLLIRAPRNGTVLQINIREGEFVSTTPAEPPILFGDVEQLQVRVDVDEVNASLVKPNTKAVAYLKGDTSNPIPLEFVRIDPYIVPKRSLTGANTERVDVRVLQVIYRFKPDSRPVYVGQQVDVFIESSS
ncbi:MAG: HlyD family efflux transporter periplasmic adaptor subunit, partial [Nitrososphaera sp.]|nr:HlyD family efflux transporter periplasmic adaptor subunit [Nitrososphaera sp.]